MSTQPIRSALTAALLLAAATPVATAADPELFGPTPYLSFADSPFKPLFPSSFSYFYLDDFETATRTPGYVINAGVNAGRRLEPSAQTDSVDWDGPVNLGNPATSLIPPGSLNGTGVEGSSWFTNGETQSLSFTFDKSLLGGRLPTHVGIVWTDVGVVYDPEVPSNTPPQGVGQVTLEVYGPNGGFLDYVSSFPQDLGDGNASGGTLEDRFLGASFSGGISEIIVYSGFSTDWEVDHLQYGATLNPIPEPEQWLLMALGIGAVALRIRRRKAAA